jgi:hypothetical protein
VALSPLAMDSSWESGGEGALTTREAPDWGGTKSSSRMPVRMYQACVTVRGLSEGTVRSTARLGDGCMASQETSEHFPDLDEGHAAGRGAKLAMAGLFLAWATMAVLAVTVLRPELPGEKHAAERAPAIAGQAASPSPFADPAAKHAAPPPSSPPAHGQAQASRTVKPAASRAPAATGTPAARPSSTPQPTAPVPPAPTAAPTSRPSGGSAHPGLPTSVSICSQAGSASSIGSIIKDIQACASGLASP